MLRTIIALILISLVCTSSIYAQNLPTVKTLEEQLTDEIIKFDVDNDGDLDHLRTTYVWGPDFRYGRNNITSGVQAGVYVQQFDDLFHNPADTLYTLAIAYPHLNTTLQNRVRDYLQYVYTFYEPYRYDHMGIAGVPREINDIPTNEFQYRPNPTPPIALTYNSYGLSSNPTTLTGFPGWSFNPFNYYALAKYAEIVGNASAILNSLTLHGHTQPPALPTDTTLLQKNPHIVNSYIAGYYGYQGLRQLAGLNPDAINTSRLQTALQTRVGLLPVDQTDAINLSSFESGGFLWLVPELGNYLYQNASNQVTLSVNTWKQAIPYYMIPNVEEATRMRIDFYNEGSHAHLYDESSLFLAQAFAQKKTRPELENLLHGPGLYRGDLFFIQNLVAAIEAPSDPNYTPPPTSPTQIPIDTDLDGDDDTDWFDLSILISHFHQLFAPGNFNLVGLVDIFDFNTLISNL